MQVKDNSADAPIADQYTGRIDHEGDHAFLTILPEGSTAS
jgi:hypothetical protein